MDNSAARNKWMDREALENYRHAMRICCMNALHVCSDEALSELCYDLDISRNGDARAYEHLLGGQCMVITRTRRREVLFDVAAAEGLSGGLQG